MGTLMYTKMKSPLTDLGETSLMMGLDEDDESIYRPEQIVFTPNAINTSVNANVSSASNFHAIESLSFKETSNGQRAQELIAINRHLKLLERNSWKREVGQ